MVGHSEVLDTNEAVMHWKAKGLDFSTIFFRPTESDEGAVVCTQTQKHGLEKALDNVILEKCKDAIERKTPVAFELPIHNVNRTVGTMTGAEISRKWGSAGLPDDTIRIKFKGSAGQSFGAFVPRGMSLTLEGDFKDYVGKGLCGGKIVVYPPKTSSSATWRSTAPPADRPTSEGKPGNASASVIPVSTRWWKGLVTTGANT